MYITGPEIWKRNYVSCRDSLTFNLTRDYFIIPNDLLIEFVPTHTLLHMKICCNLRVIDIEG